MRILGIDPGTLKTGWGVIDVPDRGAPPPPALRGRHAAHVDCGVIRPHADEPLHVRLLSIHAGLRELVALHRPDVAAVESVFHCKNARSALVLGHARGVALVTLAEAALEVVEYPPATVKLSTVGNGRADKNQVTQMVRIILGLPEAAQEDASDALAVALCHAHHA